MMVELCDWGVAEGWGLVGDVKIGSAKRASSLFLVLKNDKK